jgi:hypothetical protein
MKSTWVMTEEEKMDKKLRATAKKTPDGTPVVKAKLPPAARRTDNMTNVLPPSGTLQSYMARRKLELNRKRRQNQPSTITSSSTSGEKTNSKNLSKKYDRNGGGNISDPQIKIEVNSFEMFDSDHGSMMDTSDNNSFIKMEQDENMTLNSDRKRHSTENTVRLESFCSRESSGDENSFDNDSYYTPATRLKVDSALNSISTSPVPQSFNVLNDSTDFSSLFRDNNHTTIQQNNNNRNNNRNNNSLMQQHLEPIGTVEEREELISSFSPLSRDMSSIAASPASLSYPMSNSMSPSPSGCYPLSNNDLKVEVATPSGYSPSPSSLSYPMSNELKTESAFNSLAPASVPSFHILGDGDFSSFFSDQMSSSPHINNNHNSSGNTHHLQLRENLLNELPSTELEVYQKQSNREEHLNTYLHSDLLMLEEYISGNNEMRPLLQIQQQEHSSVASSTSCNDLSLDVFPFDQVKMHWTRIILLLEIILTPLYFSVTIVDKGNVYDHSFSYITYVNG